MNKQELTREQLLNQLEKANDRISELENKADMLQEQNSILNKYLYSLKDACKTYFTSNTLTKEEFYTLYKRNSRGNLDFKG